MDAGDIARACADMREDGTVIAELRGHSRTIQGTLLPGAKV